MNTEELKKKILIVEDEKNIAQVIAFNLMQAGYAYDIAYDGQEGLDKALGEDYDLILLDLMLPRIDGFEVCRRIREVKATPIIIETAREEEINKILGLDLGADDYVTKPFGIKELLARIKANIRRSSGENVVREKKDDAAKSEETGIYTVRNLVIDSEKYEVSCNQVSISLTKKEYELLLFLARNKGTPFSREELLEHVWGYEGFYGDLHTVDVTISRLRDKLRNADATDDYIITKRGIGYYLK